MASPFFCFFISGEKDPVLRGSDLWQLPLSGKKSGVSGNRSSEQNTYDPMILIGDYFLAATRFLSQDDFLTLKSGVESVLNRSVQTDQIIEIAVFLEKHGAFYHPLKIQVVLTRGRTCLFVLNGAVSKPGLALIRTEYQLISRLNKTCPQSYLPQVFGVDIIKTDKGDIGFLLGQWFDGFKEFHATEDHDNGEQQIVIWESDGGRHYMSQTDALPIYHEIARILTCYYDIETFEQIFPWHHAAGDFIVKTGHGKVQVRLITVRGYACLTPFDSKKADRQIHILPSLLFFFLTLTIRMRLDRLNGTGRMAMLDEQILHPVIHGFLSGLEEKTAACDFGDVRSAFIHFFRGFNLEQIMGILENSVEFLDPDPSERELLQKNVKSHCKFLHLFFKMR